MFFCGCNLQVLNITNVGFNLQGFGNLNLLLFFLFAFSFTVKGQTLTLYSFPPPHPYRWNSPHRLLVSTIRNYLSKSACRPSRMLGHMVVELKKDTAVFLTGMTSDKATDLKRSIVKDKIGLGVLFEPVSGHLEKKSQLQTELKLRTETYKAAFISFKISDSVYHYLLAYIDSFKLRGYDKIYNGLNEPRAGTGSGCTAFGISFLELIDALIPEYSSNWAVHIKVPEKLIGDNRIQKKIKLSRVFFTFKWATGKTAFKKLTLYEPYLIYQWVNKIWKKDLNNPTANYQFIKTGNARGLLVDSRSSMPVKPMFTK